MTMNLNKECRPHAAKQKLLEETNFHRCQVDGTRIGHFGIITLNSKVPCWMTMYLHEKCRPLAANLSCEKKLIFIGVKWTADEHSTMKLLLLTHKFRQLADDNEFE